MEVKRCIKCRVIKLLTDFRTRKLVQYNGRTYYPELEYSTCNKCRKVESCVDYTEPVEMTCYRCGNCLPIEYFKTGIVEKIVDKQCVHINTLSNNCTYCRDQWRKYKRDRPIKRIRRIPEFDLLELCEQK